MASLTGSIGIFSRLGSREKKLIGFVALFLVLAGSAGGYLFIESLNEEMEAGIIQAQETLVQLKTDARVFMVSMARKTALENAIKANDSKIQTALDTIASKIELEVVKNEGESLSTFDKVVRYDAKTNKRSITLGEQKQSGEKAAAKSPYMELTQPMEFSFISFAGILEFLNAVEDPAKLMYVAKLEFTPKLGKPNFVMGSTAVSTFIFEGKQEEEEE